MSEALRAFAWYIILAFNGPLNAILVGHGPRSNQPIRWQNGVVTAYDAIMIGLVYTYVLFMLFADLRLDPVAGPATRSRHRKISGAKWWQTHWRVILPHAKPGTSLRLRHGVHALRRFPARSDGAAVDHGRTGSPQTIRSYMLESQNWNAGAAYSFLYILLCTVVVTLVMWLFKVKLSEIAR